MEPGLCTGAWLLLWRSERRDIRGLILNPKW